SYGLADDAFETELASSNCFARDGIVVFNSPGSGRSALWTPEKLSVSLLNSRGQRESSDRRWSPFTIIKAATFPHVGLIGEPLMAPCHWCHAGSGRSFAAPIHGADIIAIARRYGLSFWDFVCRWADFDGKIARGRVPHFFFPDAPDVPFVLCLL